MKIYSNNHDDEVIISIKRSEIIEFASAFACKVCEHDSRASSSIMREMHDDAAIKRDIFMKLYEEFEK